MSRPGVGRLVLALATALGLLVLTPTPSWACSCAALSTAQHVQQAGTVAAGTVAWTATDGQTTTYDVQFDGVYKGAAASVEKLTTSAYDASCGLGDLATAKRYLFFIEGRHPGAMRVDLCGGTVAYDAAVARELQALTGPPRTPLPLLTHEEPPAEGGPPVGLLLFLGLGLAVVAVGTVAVVHRRRGTI